MNNIADMRKSYERAALDENASQANPLQQFDQWLQEAIASQIAFDAAIDAQDLADHAEAYLLN